MGSRPDDWRFQFGDQCRLCGHHWRHHTVITRWRCTECPDGECQAPTEYEPAEAD